MTRQMRCCRACSAAHDGCEQGPGNQGLSGRRSCPAPVGFDRPRHGPRCGASFGSESGLATFQQLVGINVVFYYGAVLWQAVGFSEADSLKINILSGALSVAACLLAIVLIDARQQATAADRLHRHGGHA